MLGSLVDLAIIIVQSPRLTFHLSPSTLKDVWTFKEARMNAFDHRPDRYIDLSSYLKKFTIKKIGNSTDERWNKNAFEKKVAV